jgi:L-2-hydroxyglutarate oxidase LhgO
MADADVAIVGGGIVGLATAWQILQRNERRRVLVLEKEPHVGMHQSGHNSGVLHSGIYYRPGSLKALNCRTGKQAMEAFCAAHGIAYDICGKVIVAVEERELAHLERIYERGQANGVRCEKIGPQRLKELEPHAAGVAAIHVPEAGIVNFREVCRKLAELITAAGGQVVCEAKVEAIQRGSDHVRLRTPRGEFSAGFLVTCGGLYADHLMRLAGIEPHAQIVPFRGEYYELVPAAQHLCRNLIYPVPDPAFPFLGVHFTRMIEGGVECGPNAVLAFAREGYRKTDVRLGELCQTLAFAGFRRLACKYWRTGAGEMWRSWNKRAFVKALARLVPDIRPEHLVPGRSGVRAMAVDPQGQMIDDFLIQPAERMVHVLSAPSPAATSALNIGRLIVEQLAAQGGV